MKPRTKFQKQVVSLSKQLAPISNTQLIWAFKNCFAHEARRLRNGTLTCLDCGHSWQEAHVFYDSLCDCTCPNCNTELVVIDTRKQKFTQKEYFEVFAVCKGFQVLRYFFLEKHCKAGKSAQLFCREVVQHWIAPDGKSEIMARSRGMSVIYYDVWNWSSDLEIRREHLAHRISPIATYPVKRFIPEVKRNGFCGNFHNLSPRTFFRNILSDSKMETLLKSKQYDLFRHFSIKRSKTIADYWASIKICIRNSYTISDASLWCDYVDLLRFFDKDVLSAKFVCPADLKAEHDRYMYKKQTYQIHKNREQERELILKNEKIFEELKAKFFGLEFSDGLLHVRILQSINDFYEEGQRLKHCVYTNEYFLKPDTLVFSAQIGGKRIETVEVSLETLKVIQARGVCNQNTEYHDQIISLVNRNAHLIRKRMTV
ncbi:PcfJ domain-containing protein [Petrimonas sp.]|uniref:PcfJ domain-containing protein n=1 Tax=Petrimonas sp. TaxID=2023866 RepID=UPI003F514EF5